jgi:hypothetical protein
MKRFIQLLCLFLVVGLTAGCGEDTPEEKEQNGEKMIQDFNEVRSKLSSEDRITLRPVVFGTSGSYPSCVEDSRRKLIKRRLR